ncbi:hypothetical protein D9M71_601420 [compost metagenome]
MRQGVAAQAVAVGAEFVGLFAVEALQGFVQLVFQRLPACSGEEARALAGGDFQNVGWKFPVLPWAIELASQQGWVDAIVGVFQQYREGRFQTVATQRCELGQPFRAATVAGRGEGIEDAAAADGALRRLVAQDQAVAVHGVGWGVQYQLGEGAFAGQHTLTFEQGNPSGDVLRGDVYVQRRPVRQRAGLAGQQVQFDIDAGGRRVQRRRQQPVAAMDIVHS